MHRNFVRLCQTARCHINLQAVFNRNVFRFVWKSNNYIWWHFVVILTRCGWADSSCNLSLWTRETQQRQSFRSDDIVYGHVDVQNIWYKCRVTEGAAVTCKSSCQQADHRRTSWFPSYAELNHLRVGLVGSRRWFQSFWARSQNSEIDYKLRHICPSVRPHGTIRLPLDGFWLNLIFEFIRKYIKKIQVSLKSEKYNGYFT